MNKIIVHYCGGAGLNIARDINEQLSSLGDGFCQVESHYIDTSLNNLGDLDANNFWRIGSNKFSNNTIDGSGGERRTNNVAIVENMKSYLDEHNYTAEVIGEYHIVVFSGSGGTGSVVSPSLIANLRTRGIPVLGVMIGDSSNGLSCKNTLNTIATMDHIAKNAVKKPVSLVYYNNHTTKGKGSLSKERSVNESILNTLTVMSLFLSGKNDDIDTKDMINFLSPDRYSTIQIAPSVYCVNIYVNDETVNNPDTINLIGRTLSVPEQEADVKLTLLQHKYGKIVVQNAIDKVCEAAPIHMVLTGNCLVAEHAALTETVAEYEAIMESLTTTNLGGTSDADDCGMIF